MQPKKQTARKEIFAMAVKLHDGNEIAAKRWMGTKSRALGGKTANELAKTSSGAEKVRQLIGRIEHGVYS